MAYEWKQTADKTVLQLISGRLLREDVFIRQCLCVCCFGLLIRWFAGANQGMNIPFSIWPTYFWPFRNEPVINWWSVQSGSILGLLRYLPLLYTYHNSNCTKKSFLRTSKRLLKQNIKIIFVILKKIFKIVVGKSVKYHESECLMLH